MGDSKGKRTNVDPRGRVGAGKVGGLWGGCRFLHFGKPLRQKRRGKAIDWKEKKAGRKENQKSNGQKESTKRSVRGSVLLGDTGHWTI